MSIDSLNPMIDNYIYMYHTNTYIVLPTYPQRIVDTMSTTFSSTTILGRSAPVFSYSNSGPRTLPIELELHRDMMYQINRNNSTVLATIEADYVDRLIKEIQAAAVPNYDASNKMVDPPLVAIRIGNDVYCKGIISSGITITYDLPILKGDRYAKVAISFTMSEVDPFDAEVLMQLGSYRNLSTSLDRTQVSSSLRNNTTSIVNLAVPRNLNVIYA